MALYHTTLAFIFFVTSVVPLPHTVEAQPPDPPPLGTCPSYGIVVWDRLHRDPAYWMVHHGLPQLRTLEDIGWYMS